MPMKGKESVYNTPPREKTSSQQTLYFKEIVDLTARMTGEAWEGFDK